MGGVGVRDVDNVQQHRRIGQLLERGPEGGDELRRQLLDEADGVGEQRRVRGVEIDLARQRVERCEELVLHEDLAIARQRAHERALPGVRVADERDDRHALALAAASVERALVADVLDLLLELEDALPGEAAVGLDLGLAGAADADGARSAAVAAEPLQVAPLPLEARQQVLGLRQLDLQAALTRAGAHREDVEDQRRAVQHLHLQRVLEVRLLRRGELVVEDDHRRTAGRGAERANLVELALAGVRGRVRRVETLQAGADDFGARGLRQQREFGERAFAAPAVAVVRALHADEVRAFGFVRGAVQGLACGCGASWHLG